LPRHLNRHTAILFERHTLGTTENVPCRSSSLPSNEDHLATHGEPRNDKARTPIMERNSRIDERAARVWQLVHEARVSIKNAARTFGVSTSEIFELLAFWKLRRQALEARLASRAGPYHDRVPDIGLRGAAVCQDVSALEPATSGGAVCPKPRRQFVQRKRARKMESDGRDADG
jgi:hypothetical protein